MARTVAPAITVVPPTIRIKVRIRSPSKGGYVASDTSSAEPRAPLAGSSSYINY
jgi:hypothetical protein